MSFITALIEGVLLGGYYAMIACGLSFMFGVMRIINLAHGSLAIVAAFALWTIADRYEYDPFLALIVVLPVMGGLGWLLQRGILERRRAIGRTNPNPQYVWIGDCGRERVVRSASAPTFARSRRM